MHISSMCPDDEIASLWFMNRDARYEHEKPFVSNYRQLNGSFPTNVQHTPHDGIVVHNLRKQKLTYEDNGICLMPMPVDISYEDYNDKDKVEGVLLPQLRDRIMAKFGAIEVHILEYRVGTVKVIHILYLKLLNRYDDVMRIFLNQWEIAKVMHNLQSRPMLVDEIVKEVREADKDKWLQNRIQALNAWAPLKGPLRDWPLCVCDSKTAGLEDDLQETDVLCPNRVSENLQLHFSEQQRWFYVKDHMPEEWLLFRSVDSAMPRFAAVPHCAFQCAEGLINDMRRESIEMRILVLHDELRA